MAQPDAPPHVIAYRKRAAKIARKFLYGRETQCPPESLVRWARMIASFTKSGELLYREILGLAEELGNEMAPTRPDFPHEYNDQHDWAFYRIFRDRLIDLSRTIQDTDWGKERLEHFRDNVEYGQRKMWAREALLNGLCPVCGQDVSERDNCGHGYGRPQKHDGGWLVDG